MQFADLEEFNKALALVEQNRLDAAHTILARLRKVYPNNSRVLLCYAFTAPDVEEARRTLEVLARMEPGNTSLSAAYTWLERQQEKHKDGLIYSPWKPCEVIEVPPELPAPAPVTPRPPELFYDEPTIPLPYQPTPKKLKEAGGKRDLSLWFVAACLVLALGVLAWFASDYYRVALDFNDTERGYWNKVAQINREADTATDKLAALSKQPVHDAAWKVAIREQLQVYVRLNEQFRRLGSPSNRFERSDSLLTMAYNYYSEGAQLIIDGLNEGSPDRISEGNRRLLSGNNFIRQARQELVKLGKLPG